MIFSDICYYEKRLERFIRVSAIFDETESRVIIDVFD